MVKLSNALKQKMYINPKLLALEEFMAAGSRSLEYKAR